MYSNQLFTTSLSKQHWNVRFIFDVHHRKWFVDVQFDQFDGGMFLKQCPGTLVLHHGTGIGLLDVQFTRPTM